MEHEQVQLVTLLFSTVWHIDKLTVVALNETSAETKYASHSWNMISCFFRK